MRIVFIGGGIELSTRALEIVIDIPIQLVGVCTLKESKFNDGHLKLR